MDKLAESEQQLLEKIRQLPQEKLVEVEDFVDFLMQRAQKVLQRSVWDQEITAMADDPDIQTELAAINTEFAVTEMDGLADS
ncbi:MULTISPECIES: DUF2281 domain-containing protein [Leptolyngbya]|jgi:hypothetical protein|uniref:Uncharacterized protein n=2 Tax=Leptolyngbya boryana TaxID=1184 RepID=A0A1Z4JEJ3_LEPBY|nr:MULTISPECIES: DUF2281 domain-containing protein [Leptolyngbya]BAY54897.1 hypothetical protein NIES2135_17160 [Leptolyngbya boryana NIES-2135]MBN8560967.1 DUF2281 domain-containing protein [Leptolyngbya sp. UWPOB_LEPTO1]MCY6491121.1 DUF2281 domain-containing protein [Leptolyngbya sp. GGD]ULP31805.1 DUF2281 domain-containing protein [Leptolyngbya boryana IU 594]WNZ46108.1 DUF2281 domain-containing protein [Leptolyngbya boryana CZ1]